MRTNVYKATLQIAVLLFDLKTRCVEVTFTVLVTVAFFFFVRLSVLLLFLVFFSLLYTLCNRHSTGKQTIEGTSQCSRALSGQGGSAEHARGMGDRGTRSGVDARL